MNVKRKPGAKRSTGRLVLAALLCLGACLQQACQSPQSGPSEYHVGFSNLELDHTGPEGGNETLTAAVWYPTAQEPHPFTYGNGFESTVARDAIPYRDQAPYPLIVFNHGLYSSKLSCLALTEHLARQGFIVIAPDYLDAAAPDFIEQATARKIQGETELTNPVDTVRALADLQALANAGHEAIVSYIEQFRLRKASFVIDSMLTLNQDRSSAFHGLVDSSAIGMAGHSLGGLTTLGLIGAYDEVSINDDRIRAALIMSAPDPFREGIGHVSIPIMIMHGDIDLPSLVPLAETLYAKAQAARFYMVIRLATHFTFGNAPCQNHDSIPQCQRNDEHVRLINGYATAFFARYLKHDIQAEEELQRSNLMLSRYDRELRQ